MMKTTAKLAALFAITFACGATPAAPPAPDEAAWQQAYARVIAAKQKRNRDPRAFVDAILGLGEATYPKRDADTLGVLLNFFLEELKDDTADGRKEERIDGLVLEACETALRKITDPKAVAVISGRARDAKLNLRLRFHLCRALGVHKGEMKVLVDLLEDRDARVQIGATDGLREQLKSELSKKVDEMTLQVNSGSDQASQILSAAGKALEEQPAALFKLRCDSVPLLLEGFLTGFNGKDDLLKATEEMRGIANGIAGEEPKRKVTPLVTGLSEFVDKFVRSVEDLNALRKTLEPAMTPLLKILADAKRPWEVRIGALNAVKADRHASQVDSFIECLQVSSQADGRLKVDVMTALAAILGVKDPRTDDPNWWKGALAERRSGKLPGTSGGTTITPTEFFGLKTKSTRIVFILDKTGSMDFKCTEAALPPKKEAPPKKGSDVVTGDEKLPPADDAMKRKAGDIKKKYDDRKIEKRMDALKREFINTIYNLDPRVHFAVITYEMNPFNWKPGLVQANWANKFECIKDMDKLSPAGGTNIWDGLENAFRFVAEPKRPEVVEFKKDGNYVTTVNGADTFFLMTDGNHNNGRFAGGNDFDERAFFAEFKKINTVRRVVVNTIILGDTTQSAENQDPIKQKSLSLFRQIAEVSGGAFVHLGQ
jgi:hypothetical protein